MRRAWPLFAAVGVVGALAGVAIAGRPSGSDPFVVDPSRVTTFPLPTLATLPPTSAPATTASSASSDTPDTTSASSVSAVTTSVTAAPTSAAVTTVAARPQAQVRVVVANGAGRGGLAVFTAGVLRQLGYQRAVPTDANAVTPTSAVYFREGFEAEALRLATEVGRPGLELRLLAPGTRAVSDSDAQGDLVLLLGTDTP